MDIRDVSRRCSQLFASPAPITALVSLRERLPPGEFFAAVQFCVRNAVRGTSHVLLMRLHNHRLHSIGTIELSSARMFDGAHALIELPGSGDLLCAVRAQLELYCVRRLPPRTGRTHHPLRFSLNYKTLALADPLLDLCALRCVSRCDRPLTAMCHADSQHSVRLYTGIDGGVGAADVPQPTVCARWQQPGLVPQRVLWDASHRVLFVLCCHEVGAICHSIEMLAPSCDGGGVHALVHLRTVLGADLSLAVTCWTLAPAIAPEERCSLFLYDQRAHELEHYIECLVRSSAFSSLLLSLHLASPLLFTPLGPGPSHSDFVPSPEDFLRALVPHACLLHLPVFAGPSGERQHAAV